MQIAEWVWTVRAETSILRKLSPNQIASLNLSTPKTHSTMVSLHWPTLTPQSRRNFIVRVRPMIQSATLIDEPFQQCIELNEGRRCRIVADRVRQYQPTIVNLRPTAVDDIGNVTVTFVVERFE